MAHDCSTRGRVLDGAVAGVLADVARGAGWRVLCVEMNSCALQKKINFVCMEPCFSQDNLLHVGRCMQQ